MLDRIQKFAYILLSYLFLTNCFYINYNNRIKYKTLLHVVSRSSIKSTSESSEPKKYLSRGRGGGSKDNKGKSSIDRDDNLDTLEKQLLGKYGSNAFKEALLIEEQESEKEFIIEKKSNKRFEGFNPTSKGNNNRLNDKIVGSKDKISKNELLNDNLEIKVVNTLNRLRPNKNDDDINNTNTNTNTIADSSLLKRLSARIKKVPSKKVEVEDNNDFSEDTDIYESIENEKKTKITINDDYEGNEEDKEYEEPRSGALNAIGGFRLRKPVPLTAEQIQKEEDKNRKLLQKEEEQKLKRKAKREEEKSQFFPFNFDDDEDSTDNDKIFTTKTFEEIGVTNPLILNNLQKMGIFNPTKIQEKAVPSLKNNNVVMHAQTGSGKTLAYLLPLLDIIDPSSKRVQALIFAPSRELVTQITLVATALFEGTGINAVSIIGGANIKGQINRLRDEKPQIVISTPGRLAEIVFSYEKLKLGNVRAVIVDEIDNLLKEAFIDSLQVLLEATPVFRRRQISSSSTSSTDIFIKDSNNIEDEEGEFVDVTADEDDPVNLVQESSHQMICFASATSNDPIVNSFADKYLGNNWKRIAVESSSMLPSTITHGIISTPRIKALEMLRKFLHAKPFVKSGLIFVNDPHRVEIVCEKLLEMGMIAAPLHGETSKDDRKEILTRLRDGRVTLVVTTELAARGLDIPDLTHVVNFELPTDAQHYVHRAGRCGRAGRKGLVINFAMTDTKFVIRRFGKQLGAKIMDCEIREGQVFLKRK